MLTYVLFHGVAAVVLLAPAVLGFWLGVTGRPLWAAPLIVIVVSAFVLVFLSLIWIKPDGECAFHECVDEDWLAGVYATITILWCSIAAGSAYLAATFGRRVRTSNV